MSRAVRFFVSCDKSHRKSCRISEDFWHRWRKRCKRDECQAVRRSLFRGSLGEQLDLWLVKHNIGSLWYGIGKPDLPEYQGLDYVIMLAVHKVSDETKFRKDLFKAKRKPLEKTWSGEGLGVAEIARFAPSACNSQPWYVENRAGELTVYRYREPGRRGIMPASAAAYFNRIDIGIYLCILEVCLQKNGRTYERALFPDDGGDAELTKVAAYQIG